MKPFLRSLRSSVYASLCIGLSLANIGIAEAGLIRSAVAANVLAPLNEDSPIVNTFNQTGLSTTYVSGVTDFASYMALNPTQSVSLGRWVSNSATTGSIIYDLGAAYTINTLAFWNQGGDSSQSVINFSVDTSNVSDFSSGVSNVGSFTADPNTGPTSAVVAEQFSLSPSIAQYLRFNILSNNGNGSVVSFSEIAFDTDDVITASVASPASLGMLALGLLGVAYRRP